MDARLVATDRGSPAVYGWNSIGQANADRVYAAPGPLSRRNAREADRLVTAPSLSPRFY